jgi:hypothetical protein
MIGYNTASKKFLLWPNCRGSATAEQAEFLGGIEKNNECYNTF